MALVTVERSTPSPQESVSDKIIVCTMCSSVIFVAVDLAL